MNPQEENQKKERKEWQTNKSNESASSRGKGRRRSSTGDFGGCIHRNQWKRSHPQRTQMSTRGAKENGRERGRDNPLASFTIDPGVRAMRIRVEVLPVRFPPRQRHAVVACGECSRRCVRTRAWKDLRSRDGCSGGAACPWIQGGGAGVRGCRG